jgi:hypothetical protein
MTKEQAIALASARMRLQSQQAGEADMRRMADPTSGMGGLEKFNAGMGKAFTDIGRGAGQMIGMGPSAEETAETRRLDAPLMNTGGGMAGNIAGNVAALAPLAVVPGGASVVGAGALGALAGGLQPTEGAGERLTNMAVGGGLGAGTQAATGPMAKALGERAAGKEAALRTQQSQNVVADETLRRGREAGYVLPPSTVSDSFVGRRLESIAGKAALGQEAAIRNQPVTDRLAREAASLRPEQPISLTNMRQARFELAAPHREVAAISKMASDDLGKLQQARFDSKMAWKEYNRQGNRAAFNDATKAGAEVKRLELALERHAQGAGRPDLVEALKVARTKIAQNRQVQDAMNRGTGSVDASVIGRALDSGAPLTGSLETIGRFQQAYKQAMREASTVPTPGVSKSEALAGALLGTAGAAAGGPGGLLAGGLPLLSGPTRSMLLSRPVQEAALTPNYAPGLLTRKTAALADPETRRRAALLARAIAIPTAAQGK